MSQNDFDVANQSGAAYRADVNTALQALASCSSGASAPATTYANMLWYDTTNSIMMQRNAANSAWVNFVPGSMPIIAAGGTADAITATYVPAVTLADQTICFFRATAANATTTPTFAPNGLTARTIVKKGGVALAAGDIPGNRAIAAVIYDLSNTRWELLNPASGALLNDSVTFAIMQNIAANSFIGRAASSSGDASEIALAASQLAGRGSSGDLAAITLGSGLTMTGTSLSVSSASQLVLLSTATASASSTISFTSLITSAYDTYLVVFKNLLLSATATLNYLASTNNGSTYAVGLFSQKATLNNNSTTAPTYTGSGSSPAILTTSQTTGLVNGHMWIDNPLGTSASNAAFRALVSHAVAPTALYDTYGVAYDSVDVDAIRFQPSSGNFTSGNIYLYGIKNT